MNIDITSDLGEETASEAARRVGSAKAIFDTIRVDYSPQISAIAALDEVRFAAKGRPPGAPCGGAMIVAPHGCGKTLAFKRFQDIAQAAAEDGQKPVVLVEISTAGTTESVATSFLQALGVARPDVGNEKARWLRVDQEARAKGVELFGIDEFNRAARRPRMSRPIATVIRERIMDSGLAPVAFIGSEDAGTVLAQVPELVERLDDDIDLSPLSWDRKGDRELFMRFVTDLDRAMVDAGVFGRPSGLGDDIIAKPLWEASSGRVRRICKIVRAAMAAALHDRRSMIERDDLAYAVDVYSLPRDHCHTNPFTRGARQ